jgi:hypothetical protein
LSAGIKENIMNILSRRLRLSIFLIVGVLLSVVVPALAASASLPAVASPSFAGASPNTESTPIDPGLWNQKFPSAAGDVAGNIFVVWEDYREGTVSHIRFAERPADSNWQSSLKLDPTAAGNQKFPQIAVDGSGNLYAVWEDYRRAEYESLIYFAYKPVGGNWSVSEPVSATTGVQAFPSLAVNRRGEAVVSWRQRPHNKYNYTIYSAIRSVEGNWGEAEPKTVNPGEYVGTTGVTIDDWGRVYLAWENWDTNEILFSERSPGGVWSANEQIRDTTTGSTWAIKIAVDGVGDVHAVWEDGRSGERAYAADRPVHGPWSVNVRLDEASGDVWSPGLGIDGAGNVIAAWSEGAQVFGAVRYLGSDWGPNELFGSAPTSFEKGSREAPDRVKSISGPRSIESWTPGFAGVGVIPSLIWVVPSTGGFDNIFESPLSSPGAGGDCGKMMSALGASGAKPTSGNACHAGNAAQEPPQEGDPGFIGPPGPPEGWQAGGWEIQTQTIDGQEVYVVDTPGSDGVFTSAADAAEFASEYVYVPSSGSLFNLDDVNFDVLAI